VNQVGQKSETSPSPLNLTWPALWKGSGTQPWMKNFNSSNLTQSWSQWFTDKGAPCAYFLVMFTLSLQHAWWGQCRMEGRGQHSQSCGTSPETQNQFEPAEAWFLSSIAQSTFRSHLKPFCSTDDGFMYIWVFRVQHRAWSKVYVQEIEGAASSNSGTSLGSLFFPDTSFSCLCASLWVCTALALCSRSTWTDFFQHLPSVSSSWNVLPSSFICQFTSKLEG
jgi:hypothetical protein